METLDLSLSPPKTIFLRDTNLSSSATSLPSSSYTDTSSTFTENRLYHQSPSYSSLPPSSLSSLPSSSALFSTPPSSSDGSVAQSNLPAGPSIPSLSLSSSLVLAPSFSSSSPLLSLPSPNPHSDSKEGEWGEPHAEEEIRVEKEQNLESPNQNTDDPPNPFIIRDAHTPELEGVYVFPNDLFRSGRKTSDRSIEMIQGDPKERRIMNETLLMPHPYREPTDRACRSSCPTFVNILAKMTSLFYLAILGTVMGLLSVAMDVLGYLFFIVRDSLILMTEIWYEKYFIYIMWTVALTLTGTIFTFIEPNAIGSGIPELKSLLTGAKLPNYLTWQVFFAKFFGLTIILGGNQFLGKEGPFVHMSAIIAKKMLNLRIFRSLKANPALAKQLITASITAGVAASVSAPVGGLLFSIEVTSNYWPTRSYSLAFFVATVACMVYIMTRNFFYGNNIYRPLIHTSFPYTNFTPWEILLFALLGVVMGTLGSLFVLLNGKIVEIKKSLVASYPSFFGNFFFYSMVISLLVGSTCYPGVIGDAVNPHSPRAAFQSLLSMDTLSNGLDPLFEGPGHYVPAFASLMMWFITHYILLPIVLTAPLPSGISLPLIAIGAAFGRGVGKFAFARLHGTQVAGAYALIGGAGLLSGVTQAYSSTIIVMEMTGQLEYLFPLLISVVISVTVSRAIGISIFERIVLDKKLPYLPRLKVHQYRITARELMEPLAVGGAYLLPNCYVEEIDQALQATTDKWIPVVNSFEERVLLGTVSRKDLIYLKKSAEETQSAELTELMIEAELERDDFETQLELGYSGVTLNVIKAAKKENFRDISLDERARDASNEMCDSLMLEEPMQFAASTPMTFLHLLFTTQSLQFGFVTKNGRLVGILRRIHLEKLLRYSGNTN